jgi:hypothetical protein
MGMRPLQHLTFESLRDLLCAQFRQVPDGRDPQRITWKLHDVLLSGFAMFYFQHPNMLQFQQSMEKRTGQSNLQRLFGVKQIPSDTQMRALLDDPAAQEPLRRVLPEVFERMRRTGWTARFLTEVQGEKYYTLALDGSQYFSSTKIACPACLQRKDKNGDLHYSHVVVGATLVRAGSHDILPLDAEEVRNTDGREKQDCEINAGKRLVQRLRQEHRQLPVIIVGDDLYAHEPFILELRGLRLGFVLVAKPASHQELYEWVEDLDRLGQCVKGQWEEGPLAKRRYFEYRIVSQVPLTQSDQVLVNFVEVWERHKAGKVIYHNAWVTDFAVTPENVATIVGIGRARWKIENEQFNVQKNHGYELEHNYGHGERGLSLVLYLLNLLAFLAHQVLEMGDRLYRACRANGSRRYLWQHLRVYFQKLPFESWTALLEFHLSDPVPDP